MDIKILEKILEFSFGYLSPEEFESWLYCTKGVEEIIGNENYFNFISTNYTEKAHCIKIKIHASKIVFMLDHKLWSIFYKNAIEKLINLISMEFRDVARNDGVTLHQAAVLDNRGSAHEFEIASKLDQDCHWKDISQEVIKAHPFILPFLDNTGFAYYIPAYINCILCEIKNKMKCDELLCWNICYNLSIDSNQGRSRFEIFSCGQKNSIYRFLMLMALSNNEECNPEICEKSLLDYLIEVNEDRRLGFAGST